jgi:cobalamin biosynthesis Mg chelatase CobN
VSAINPGAGQSIFRKNLEAAESAYYIAASQPHNSSQNDLAAAFGQSQTFEPVSTTKANPVAKVAVATSSSTQAIVASSSPVEGEGGVTEILNIQATSTLNTNFQSRQNKSAGIKYLILSVLAFLTLILVVYTSFFKKKE